MFIKNCFIYNKTDNSLSCAKSPDKFCSLISTGQLENKQFYNNVLYAKLKKNFL